MTSRSACLLAVASIGLAACGGGSEGADTTIPEITLLTTTSEAPLFDEVDTEPEETPGTAVLEDETAPTDPSETTTTATTAPTDTTVDPDPTTPVDAGGGSDPDVDPGTDTTGGESPVVTDAPSVTSPTASASDSFVLGADGLGAVAFGADPEQTITFVTSLLGAPTSDTGWVPPFDIGPCGGTQIRQVSWNQLQLEFGDVSDVTEGRDHFYAYYYGAEGSSTPIPAGLVTPEGIGAGSSVAALIAAYPGVKLFAGDDFVGPSFSVNDNLTGRMSGLADDDLVEVIIGGIPCEG